MWLPDEERGIVGSRNLEILKILKTWWKGSRSKEQGVDGEEGEEG
jgi:hypothetical protein